MNMLMTLTSLLMLSSALIFQVELPQRELHLTLTDAHGQPVTDQQVRLQVYLPHFNQECVTDSKGDCIFLFSAETTLIRGRLSLVGRGIRPVIWRGERLDLHLQLQENGLIEIPIDFALQEIALIEPSTTPTTKLEQDELDREAQHAAAQIGTDTPIFSPVEPIVATQPDLASTTSDEQVSTSAETAPDSTNNTLYFILGAIGLALFFAVIWLAFTYRGDKR